MIEGQDDKITHAIHQNVNEGKDTVDLQKFNFLPSLRIQLNDDLISHKELGIYTYDDKKKIYIPDLNELKKYIVP